VIGFLFKNYIKSINDNISKLLTGIDAIKSQVNEIKTDMQLQASAMREVETRVEYRLQNIENRIIEIEKDKTEQSVAIRNLDHFMQKIQIHHNRQHPQDKI
jgi:carbon monoxide dehydrogenase subunit G